MLTDARQAIRSKYATPLLVVAVVALLAVAAVGSSAIVTGSASSASPGVFGMSRSNVCIIPTIGSRRPLA